MVLTINESPADLLEASEIEAWRSIPAGIVGNQLNRSVVMRAEMRPLRPGTPFAAQALTVQCMVGDDDGILVVRPD